MTISPLDALHREGGASFTDFAGWDMPVRYSSDLAEHHIVRESAGLFDISHMAELRVRGSQAADFLDYALAGRLSSLVQGQAKYSLILTETGGIVDDVIVYRLADEEYLVIANAGNRFPALDALQKRTGSFDVTVTDESDETALIAIQGPKAAGILEGLDGFQLRDFAGDAIALDTLGYYRATPATYNGADVFVARTGYTGEDGFELALANEHAAGLWKALAAAGAEACGLAARDTLRLEAGMPLYGHELGLDIRPEQAGVGRVPVMSKDNFVGKAALEAEPSGRVLVGLVSEGKRAGRAGYPITHGGSVVGEVSSGALSPTLGFPIAMAFVERHFAEPGTVVNIDVRGTEVPATVTQMPFYTRQK